MGRILTSIAVAAVSITGMIAAPAQAGAPRASVRAVEELLDLDRRYARESGQAAGPEGIVRMFDEDVVIFAVPVPGFARGRTAAAAALSAALGEDATATEWVPIRGGISEDGTHGFTFGYMTSQRAGKPALLAKYLSYWIKTGAGWRVKLFKRVPRPEGEVSTALMPPSLPAGRGSEYVDLGKIHLYAEDLRRREQDFSDTSQKVGLSAAFAAFGAADAVNAGGGPSFVVSPTEIAKMLPTTSPLHWSADQGVLVAPSGDLGVTWGYLRRNGPVPEGKLGEIPFFTIWRRAGLKAPWLFVAE